MDRKSFDSLGALQKSVLETLWNRGAGTVREIRDWLPQTKPLAYTSVLSTLQKLEKAGWVSHRAKGKMHVYSAAHTKDEASASSFRRFVGQYFDGRNSAFFQHLLDHKHLSDDELHELQEMIDGYRKERQHEHGSNR